MYSIRIETINNLIGSMNARLNDVIRNKANRTRYCLVLYVFIARQRAMHVYAIKVNLFHLLQAVLYILSMYFR